MATRSRGTSSTPGQMGTREGYTPAPVINQVVSATVGLTGAAIIGGFAVGGPIGALVGGILGVLAIGAELTAFSGAAAQEATKTQAEITGAALTTSLEGYTPPAEPTNEGIKTEVDLGSFRKTDAETGTTTYSAGGVSLTVDPQGRTFVTIDTVSGGYYAQALELLNRQMAAIAPATVAAYETMDAALRELRPALAISEGKEVLAIDKLKGQITAYGVDIAGYEAQIASYGATIAGYKTDIKSHEAAIQGYETQIEGLGIKKKALGVRKQGEVVAGKETARAGAKAVGSVGARAAAGSLMMSGSILRKAAEVSRAASEQVRLAQKQIGITGEEIAFTAKEVALANLNIGVERQKITDIGTEATATTPGTGLFGVVERYIAVAQGKIAGVREAIGTSAVGTPGRNVDGEAYVPGTGVYAEIDLTQQAYDLEQIGLNNDITRAGTAYTMSLIDIGIRGQGIAASIAQLTQAAGTDVSQLDATLANIDFYEDNWWLSYAGAGVDFAGSAISFLTGLPGAKVDSPSLVLPGTSDSQVGRLGGFP